MRNSINRFALLLAVLLLFSTAAQADLFPGLKTPSPASAPTAAPVATTASLFPLPALPATGPRFSDWSKIRPAAERTIEQGSVFVFVSVSEKDMLAYGQYLERHGYQAETSDSAPKSNEVTRVYRGTDYTVLLHRVQDPSLKPFLAEAVVSANVTLEDAKAGFTATLDEMRLELTNVLATPTPAPTPVPTRVPTERPTANNNGSNIGVDTNTSCPFCYGSGTCMDCIDGKCDACFGDGTESCPRCGGSGKCSNFECYKGTITYYRNGEVAERQCPTCKGSGNCTRCEGQRTVKCSKCNGSGNCQSCQGTAKCKYCGGKRAW